MKILSLMKTICAWCGKDLGGDAQSTIISHGICERCKEQVLAELPNSSQKWKRSQWWEDLWVDMGGEG